MICRNFEVFLEDICLSREDLALKMAGNDAQESKDLMRLYREDSRIPCKYGSKCYQKNAAHHEKYKHPPDKRKLEQEENDKPKKKVRSSDSEENLDRDEISEDVAIAHEGNESEKDGQEKIFSGDIKTDIKEAFLLEMPNDFYSFWSFCESIKKQDPSGALKDVGLLLVGPFDFMRRIEDFKQCRKSDFLRHWRYYYDPPELQTVIKGDDKTEYHLGYYRDDPEENPCFVASNCSAVDCIITPIAENLFGAVNSYLEDKKSKSDPFQKMKISSLQKSLHSWAKENEFELDTNTASMRSRNRKVVTKTFHKAGIVVPVNKENDTGYRPLIEKEGDLKRILKNYSNAENELERKALMNKLQPIITAANIANDECDFGTSLELGLDLFSFGGEMFHGMILHLLCTAYSLLNREVFSEIIKAHLENRKKGVNLSVIGTRK